ncbi:MAG TPA: FAD-dependent oxidoreductase [Solirubrobacteraceae bacterium]|nr:FAD-dependent oxidoreductase [Solirubrobacteraceae bacterium]
MLDHVWRPATIGPLTVPHRLVMGSMHLGLEALDDGGAALAAFYRERVEGGAALIVTGGWAVNRVGSGGASYGRVDADGDAAKLERIVTEVHRAGGSIVLQLFHAGRYGPAALTGLQPVAPSAVYSSFSRCEPRALGEDEIHDTIQDFARAARRARELGFDGVEIMGSEGYLLSQFMAPLTNRRDDQWGGDGARRRRFPLAVAAAVRAAAGPGQAVVYRISAADLVAGGATHAEVIELARRLADGCVDALSTGIGWHEAKIPTVQGVVPPGAWRPWARAITSAVPVPVIATNRIDTAELAERVLAAGEADLVSMARPFLADAQLVRKSRGRTAGRVNRCIACNACIDRSIFDRRVSCLVNPRAGYELELPAAGAADPPPRDGRGARVAGGGGPALPVAVVGGGPAGMQAALSLAHAGYRVTLCEAAGRLGGQFRMACRIPGKESFARTIEYFEDALPRAGVSVSLGTRVDGLAALTGFDAVVVATGVVPRRLALPGSDLPHVRSYADVLLTPEGVGAVGEEVVVIGAGGVGVDIAHWLSHRGGGDPVHEFYARHGLNPDTGDMAVNAGAKRPEAFRRVTVTRRGRRVAEGVGPSSRWVVLQALERAGVEVLTGVTYERIEREAVLVGVGGDLRRLPAQRVVVAAGQLPHDALVPVLSSAGVPHVVIGGAADAAELNAERAFREGAQAPGALKRALSGAPA